MPLDGSVLLSAGFSLVCGPVLLAAYVGSAWFPRKTVYSMCAGALLTGILIALQWNHLQFVLGGPPPLDLWSYRIPLFLGPFCFFLFGRAVVMPEAPFHTGLLLHASVVMLPMFLSMAVALPILFGIGCGYAIWLSNLVYRARAQRRQRRFETAFSVLVTASALAVFALGVSLPWVQAKYFVAVYSMSVAAAYSMIVFALVAIPDLVRDLFEAAQAKYSVSKLKDGDVDQWIARLERLMDQDKLYQQNDISLASVAEALEITPHQLSELVNSRMGLGFSRYLRCKRLAEACLILREKPEQSVLSIALEVGFRSQSTFYTAFKQEFDQSPGDYRSRALRGKP